MKFCLALLTISATAFAEPTTRLSIDTDPSTFPLSGFSGWVMVKPAALEHVRFGAGGFGLEFPSFLVNVLNRTGEEGWGFGVRGAMGFAAYQFGDHRGLYVGAYAGYLQTRYTRDAMSATANHVDLLPVVGYQWFPFDGYGAYVQPWVGAITWFGGSTTIGTHTFKDPYVIPLAALHVGWEFR